MSGIPEKLKGPKLLQMAKKIGAKWTDLALTLGFEDADIERFTADNIGNQKEQIRKMLNEWVRKNVEKDPVGQLAEAFRNAELSDLAIELEGPVASANHGATLPPGAASAQTDQSQPAGSIAQSVVIHGAGVVNVGHMQDTKINQGDIKP